MDDELAEIAAHWGGRSERRYRSAGPAATRRRSSGGGRCAGAVVRRGWAERGLSISCGACGLPSFVPLAEAPARATCPGCSSPAEYETGSALAVYYRLSSHLDLLSDQGVLPHLLTIAALQRQGKQSTSFPASTCGSAPTTATRPRPTSSVSATERSSAARSRPARPSSPPSRSPVTSSSAPARCRHPHPRRHRRHPNRSDRTGRGSV